MAKHKTIVSLKYAHLTLDEPKLKCRCISNKISFSK